MTETDPLSGHDSTPQLQSEPQGESQDPPADKPSHKRPDPWAHRRAEPRTFAFIWTVYLFLATLSTYAMAMSSGIGGHDVIRPAARVLLALVASGIVLIWPLVRLSQSPDPRPIAGPVLDIVVVLIPVQAIIWPQAAWWLANWPLPVVASLAASTGAWTVLIGACISITHSRRPSTRTSPAKWMLIILAVLASVHIPAMMSSPSGVSPAGTIDHVRPSWMLSPVLSMFELSRDRTWLGSPATVFAGHWRMIGLIMGFATGLWLIAVATAIRAAGRRRASGLH